MSRARKRDNYSPSLFPFLAVLLCTMGSLVLLLMLIVSQAQASAKQVAVDKRERIEEVESQIELARNAFEKQLAERRLDLERRRLTLQHLEKHIQELLVELEEIGRTAALLDDKLATDVTVDAEQQRKISELEALLADATKDLKKKLDKPDGEKPIFAIIPYQGTNGTHRRPIYLECVDNGVLIQPEGILIGLADLRPPYGPGNPLDAALRTVRSRFAPANGALTSTAYPLLVVRPSGIRSYAMARQAMSGWDDQFGYELIDEDLPLAFPDSQPGLSAEIEKALALARERQAALVMAMPQKYRQFIKSAGAGDTFEFSEDEGGFGNDWMAGGAAASRQSSSGSSGSGSSGTGRSPLSGTRGGFSSGGSEPVGSGVARAEDFGISGSSMGIAGGGGKSPAAANQSVNDGSNWNTSPQVGQQASSGNSFFGNSGGELLSSGASGGSSGDSLAEAGGAGGRESGSEAGQPGNRGSSPGTQDSRSSRGTQASGGTAAAANQGSANGLRGTSSTAGGQASKTSNGASAGTSGPGGTAAAPSGAASSGATEQMAGNSAAPPPTDATMDPQMQNMSPSLNMDMARKQQAKSTPVAQTRGRNWAWTEGAPTKTAVVRSIRVICYSDRWVVMPEAGSSASQVTIPVGHVPQVSAEKLAKTVTDRVNLWGIALSGGYWKPELAVDVAPDAEAGYKQLVRLLEGSGLAVQRRSASN